MKTYKLHRETSKKLHSLLEQNVTLTKILDESRKEVSGLKLEVKMLDQTLSRYEELLRKEISLERASEVLKFSELGRQK